MAFVVNAYAGFGLRHVYTEMYHHEYYFIPDTSKRYKGKQLIAQDKHESYSSVNLSLQVGIRIGFRF